MSGGRVRGELAEPLRSRLGEDEDGKLKAEAERGRILRGATRVKNRSKDFFHPPLALFFCFIFAFILVFVSRLIFFFFFFLLAMAAIPTARRPPAPSDGAFFVFFSFFPSLSSPPQRDGADKKGENIKKASVQRCK